MTTKERWEYFDTSNFRKDFEDRIEGSILWEVYDEHNRFKLESWNVRDDQNGLYPVIVQFWPEGHGCVVYYPLHFDRSKL